MWSSDNNYTVSRNFISLNYPITGSFMHNFRWIYKDGGQEKLKVTWSCFINTNFKPGKELNMVLTVSSGCSWCHLTWLYRNCAKTIKNPHFMMRRCLATKKPETVMNVFDRNAKKLQKERTTILKDYKVYDYVKEEVYRFCQN